MAVRNVEYIIGLRDKFSGKMGNIQARTQALDSTMLRLRSTVGTLFAAFAAQRVISDIIKVGSNFEQLQISFETMLGSAEKAKVLLEEITQFAIQTPFELKDVAAGAKSLLAFGIAQEKIIPTLKSLGDVAAGLSVPIERLILNFGQVKTQSKLTGRELRDFAIAGVPLLDELAKVMGKTTTEVQDLVSKGAVGFPIVEQAFKNMSSEGGKFFDLMKKQTASTGGQISNLRDVVALLEDDFFKKFQPSLNAGVVALQNLIASLRANIDTVVEVIKITGKFIKFLVVYKALQLSVNLVIRAGVVANRLYTLSLVLLNRGFASSIRLMKGFRLALARTGIGLAIIALSELVILFIDYKNRLTDAEKSQLRLNKAIEKAKEKTAEQTEKLRNLVIMLNSKTKADFVQKRALNELQRIFPKYFKNLDIEKAKLIDIELVIRKLTLANEGRIIMLERVRQQEKLRVAELIQFEAELNRRLSPEEAEKLEKGIRQQKGIVAELTLKARKIKDEIARLTIQAATDKRQKDIAVAPDITGIAPDVTAKQLGITKITSAAPKIFNINIDKLVETINNNTTTLPQSMNQAKDIITEAMLTMLSDLQLQVR